MLKIGANAMLLDDGDNCTQLTFNSNNIQPATAFGRVGVLILAFLTTFIEPAERTESVLALLSWALVADVIRRKLMVVTSASLATKTKAR